MSGRRGGCCSCCLQFLLSLGITTLILWLVYRPITPRYYITDFSSSTNATFNLQIENKNLLRGIYHDPLTVSLASGPNLTAVIPAFYQGKRKTANKPATITGIVASNESAVLKVDVESSFRYKVVPWNWKSGRHSMSLGGEVAVNVRGEKTAKKGIRLSTASSLAVNGFVQLVCLVFVAFWVAGF